MFAVNDLRDSYQSSAFVLRAKRSIAAEMLPTKQASQPSHAVTPFYHNVESPLIDTLPYIITYLACCVVSHPD